jgi:hypothetical protein
VTEAFDDPALAETRTALLIAGYEMLTRETYQAVNRLEALAAEHGYPRLA